MVFTHDSIGLGEDGPTHQPVEHVASLRAMPNYWVFRPADANEVSVCWKLAIEHLTGPSALVLTRQAVPTLDHHDYAQIGDPSRGAYVISDCDGEPELILLSTGSEVSLCLQAQTKLTEAGRRVRVVSMPCWELYDEQDAQWHETVLPAGVTRRLAVEAGSPFGWHRWVGPQGDLVTIPGFGASAPAKVLFEKYGFSVDNVAARASELLG
jgi:transketolase